MYAVYFYSELLGKKILKRFSTLDEATVFAKETNGRIYFYVNCAKM